MIFKTTKDIFEPWNDELWSDNLLDSSSVQHPPSIEWDYSRELQIEDIDIWEVLYAASGGLGVYAAWLPYAEFYLIRAGWDSELKNGFETYYGPNATSQVIKRSKELGFHLNIQKKWVDPEEMWKYTNNPSNTIII
jgi:hypothetical protein